MFFDIKFVPKVLKQYKNLPKKDKERIIKAIQPLSVNPYNGKKLKGLLDGFYSLRVWPYRVIYCIIKDDFIVLISVIGHRKSVYENI